jgi:hypothetical protein
MAGAAQVSELARDLQDAAKGTVGRLERERKPYQFQSQLWIGSVFTAGRLRPKILPATTSRTPDFLLCLPGRDFGLEVKRPSSSKNLRRLVEDGAQQLAARGLHGGVAVDCSDCLPHETLFRGSEVRRQPPYVLIDREFEELYRKAGSTVFDWSRREHLPGFAHVNFVIVFAQGWRWLSTGPRGPELFTSSAFGTFTTSKGNADFWAARRIREAYDRGLGAGGLFISRTTAETTSF